VPDFREYHRKKNINDDSLSGMNGWTLFEQNMLYFTKINLVEVGVYV